MIRSILILASFLSVSSFALAASPIGNLSFAMTVYPVPDGGTSVALLGLTIVALIAFRKKFMR